MEWAKQTYNSQYDKWMPWIEDVYLRWFTNDNKASYTAKDTLDKTKVTGVEPVDHLQDGVNNLAAGQVGQGGLLQPVGDHSSKEGFNRMERQGRDDSGGYVPNSVPGATPVNNVTSTLAEGTQNLAGNVVESAKSVQGDGGLVGGLLGGNSQQK